MRPAGVLQAEIGRRDGKINNREEVVGDKREHPCDPLPKRQAKKLVGSEKIDSWALQLAHDWGHGGYGEAPPRMVVCCPLGFLLNKKHKKVSPPKDQCEPCQTWLVSPGTNGNVEGVQWLENDL